MKVRFKMIKLLALDIDGTLINSDGIITPNTIKFIKKCIENDILVTISTGRPVQGIKKFIEILELDNPLITYNGAMIVESKSKKILFNQGLLEKDAKKIIELGKKNNTSITMWANNELYVNRIDENINNYKKLSGNEPIVFNNYDEILKLGATKILWIDTIERIKFLNESIKGNIDETVTFCTSKPFYLEFFNSSVSKSIALEFIGEKYNIDKSEMIAIGDGFNDLSMIEYAGVGVAMGNAPAEVKEKADYITDTNNNDGIVKVIQKFILN
jgi:Cof subfamily protein (haloacid dehalogenase superfamily)